MGYANTFAVKLLRHSRPCCLVSGFAALMMMGPWCLSVQAEQTPADRVAAAQALLQGGKPEDARAILDDVSQQSVDAESAAMARALIGECFRREGRLPESHRQVNEVVNRDIEHPDAVAQARLTLVDVLAAQDLVDDAIFEAWLLANDPGVAPAYEGAGRLKLGKLLRQQWRLDEALEVLEPVGELAWAGDAGVRALSQLMSGEIRMDLGDRQAAKRNIEDAVRIAGEEAPGVRNWARVRLTECAFHSWAFGELDSLHASVMADHQNRIAGDHQAAWVSYWKGMARIEQKRYAEAIESLEIAVALTTDVQPHVACKALFAAGEAHRLAENHLAALSYYEQAYQQALTTGSTGANLDSVRLQLGSVLRHLGMRERGIAWLRSGIQDPAMLTGQDQLLSTRMMSFMTRNEQEQWLDYLQNPSEAQDPTTQFVIDEFGENPPGPTTGVVNHSYLRYSWRGRLLVDQERYGEALIAFENAAIFAEDSFEQAQAITGQAESLTHLSRVAWKEDGEVRGRALLADAQRRARTAVDHYIAAAQQLRGGEAHVAIEEGVYCLRRAQLYSEVVNVAERMMNAVAGDDPGKQAFAAYMHMRALSWRKSYAQAIQAAQAIDQQFAGNGDPAVTEIRVAALVRSAQLHARNGDPQRGLGILDAIDAEHPSRYTKWLDSARAKCLESSAR